MTLNNYLCGLLILGIVAAAIVKVFVIDPALQESNTAVSVAIVCPHCRKAGKVRTERVTEKRGISGGKATGALLTGGLSLFATGLSAKRPVTKCTCGRCKISWTVE